jgi:hypothetical protein
MSRVQIPLSTPNPDGVSPSGKAPDFDSGIRRFKSFHPSHDPLAQSAEHLTFNQGVPRSNRGWITKKRGRGGIGRRARLRIWYL